MKQICKSCDHCIESKQGIKCFNPKSDNFNQKVKLDDSCAFIETFFYVHPKDEETENLFQ